ncbi:MAG: hypothetical protein ACRED4_08955 [Brevundimonas sp.]
MGTSPTITGGTATFSGASIALSQTTSVNCNVSATLNVVNGPTGSGTANLSSPSISPGTPFVCGFAVFPVTPWSAQTIAGQTIPGATGTALVTVNVGANTIANDPCNPQPVQARLTTTATGSTLDFDNVVLQAASGRSDRVCRIDGTLTSATKVYIH